MKLNQQRLTEDKRVVCGKVVKAAKGDGVVTLMLEGSVWNKELGANELSTIKIPFRDSEYTKPATRLSALNFDDGKTIIAAEIYEKDGKVYGNDFLLRGRMTGVRDREDRTKDLTFIRGFACNPKKLENGGVRVGIALTDKNGETKWLNITFKNNKARNLGDAAEKIFFDAEGNVRTRIDADGNEKSVNRDILVTCGTEYITTDDDGNEVHTGLYNCLAFDLLD